MGIRDFFFKAVDIPAQQELNAAYFDNLPLSSPFADNSHLETITFANLFGLTPETLPVNRSSAMQIASVAKGRNLICTSVARMPLQAITNGSPATHTSEFLNQLERGVPNFITLSWTVDSMLFHGRSFWVVTERAQDGSPAHVRFVPESKLETKDGVLVKAFDKAVSPADVIRFDANNEGFLAYGAGVIREAHEIEAAAREAGASPVPSVVLKGQTDLATEDVQSMLAQWSANRRKRGGSVSYVNSSVDVESMGQHAENLLIDARNVASLQVARALGLPSWAVDASAQGQSLNYQNQSSRNRELIDALTGFMLSIEQTLSLFMPADTEIKFDTTELLKGDTKERYDAYAVAINAGILTADEARSYENLPPLPEEQAPMAPVVPEEPVANPEESE